jgi:hypothetical protein
MRKVREMGSMLREWCGYVIALRRLKKVSQMVHEGL